jgi:hypothetical protein
VNARIRRVTESSVLCKSMRRPPEKNETSLP